MDEHWRGTFGPFFLGIFLSTAKFDANRTESESDEETFFVIELKQRRGRLIDSHPASRGFFTEKENFLL